MTKYFWLLGGIVIFYCVYNLVFFYTKQYKQYKQNFLLNYV